MAMISVLMSASVAAQVEAADERTVVDAHHSRERGEVSARGRGEQPVRAARHHVAREGDLGGGSPRHVGRGHDDPCAGVLCGVQHPGDVVRRVAEVAVDDGHVVTGRLAEGVPQRLAEPEVHPVAQDAHAGVGRREELGLPGGVVGAAVVDDHDLPPEAGLEGLQVLHERGEARADDLGLVEGRHHHRDQRGDPGVREAAGARRLGTHAAKSGRRAGRPRAAARSTCSPTVTTRWSRPMRSR